MDPHQGRPRRPGDRVDPPRTRSGLRPLSGLLRTVEVLDNTRAVILTEDGTPYTVHGRRLPRPPGRGLDLHRPHDRRYVAHGYELPPREHNPTRSLRATWPPRNQSATAASCRLRTCWCGHGCRSPPAVRRPSRLRRGADWTGRPDPALLEGTVPLVCALLRHHDHGLGHRGGTRLLRVADDARAHRLGVPSGIRASTALPEACSPARHRLGGRPAHGG